MARASISDVVTNGEGVPIVGATVVLLRASDFAAPPTTDPGAPYVAVTTTGAGGVFAFDHIQPDDYHIMVKYGSIITFEYRVPVLAVTTTDLKQNHGRAYVTRTLSRILAGENVVIACVGDGVTVGYNATGTVAGSFVSLLAIQIGAQLAPQAAVNRYDPNAYGTLQDGTITGWNGPVSVQAASGGSGQVISVVNNGVSGDTVQRVLRRWTNLSAVWTASTLPVDLFIVQLGLSDSLTTDATKFVDPPSFYAGKKALVDIVRTNQSQAEIVLLTPHQSNQPNAGNGGTIGAGTYTLEQYATAIRRVGIESGVGIVDLRQAWADAYNPTDANIANNDGFGTWLNNAGGNHTNPTDAGHQAIADEIFKIFASPGAAPGRELRLQSFGPQRHFKELEVVRVPNGNPSLVYAGGHWSTYVPGALASLYYSAGGLQKSSTAGDTLTMWERMQDCALLVRRGPDCGQVSVTIDGGAAVQYDLYRGWPSSIADTTADGAIYPQDRLYIARGLSDTEHTVVATVLGTHDSNASASNVYIDGVEILRYGYTARKLECPVELSKVQYGAFSCTITAASHGTVALTFPKAFRAGTTPTVVGSCNDRDHYCAVESLTSTGCTIDVVYRPGTNETNTITGQWMAIG